MKLSETTSVDNLVIVGDKETGKTKYIKKYLTGVFNKKYNASIGISTFIRLLYI